MRVRRAVALVAALAAIALLVGLGVWQVERLGQKRALIAQVDARLSAAPVPAPDRAVGPEDAYTRIRTTGRYRRGADTRVQAVTDLGGGHWVLTPFDTETGRTLLVNRGFVPLSTPPAPPPPGRVAVTGLLRLTEPGGAFLRSNDPAADRWYSRDVAAIARRRGVANPLPWFLDADRAGPGWPRGGLTVVRFPDNHLVYALTWFALAGLIALLLARAIRRGDTA